VSEIDKVQNELDLANWRNSENRLESDHDSALSDLAPAVSRLLGWLNDGKSCDQIGMRVKAMIFVVRPDFLDARSLTRLSPGSKRIFGDLVADFRGTFVVKSDGARIAKC
jgi:hypothetical protein